MHNLLFSFGDGTSAKFDFSDITNVDALGNVIAAIVSARIAARSLAGLTRKRDAWSNRRFRVSLTLNGKDCSGHLSKLEFSANKADYLQLSTWAISTAKRLYVPAVTEGEEVAALEMALQMN